MLASDDENPDTIDDDELLTGTGSGGVFTSGYLSDRPLIEYLDDEERVAFLLSNKRKGVRWETDNGGNAVTPGDDYRAIAAITDTRVFIVVGGIDDGETDRTFSLPYTEIENVKTGRGVLTKRIDIWTTEGVRWRFFVRTTVDLAPAADYTELAAVVWSRVENQLHTARTYIEAVRDAADEGEYADVEVAAGRAREHIDEARRVARDLTENRNHAVWRRLLETEERLKRGLMHSYVTRAESLVEEAERQWRQEQYNKAHDSYDDAREAYEAALDIAETNEYEEVSDILAALDQVMQDIDHLSKSPLRRAEKARDRAAALEEPAVAADLWEDALEKYQTALVLDWGNENQRFAGQRDEIRAEIESIVEEIAAMRRTLSERHRSTGDWYCEDLQYERAREQYATARDHLDTALSIVEELKPDAADALETEIETLEDRIESVQERTDQEAFEFVGDETDDEPADQADPEPAATVVEETVSTDDLVEDLVALDAAVFRQTVADLWAAMGWTTTLLPPDTDRDHDIIATKADPVPEKQLLITRQSQPNIRFKRETIETSAAVRDDREADIVALVTTGAFTEDARAAAADTNVKLIDGEQLANLIADADDVEVPAARQVAE